jgi:hypothetical protein
MVAPLLALAGGALGRGAASRLGAGVLGQTAGQFGGSALASGAARRHAGHPDSGLSNYARENKGEIGVGGAFTAMTSPGLGRIAAQAFDSVISPQQFGNG